MPRISEQLNKIRQNLDFFPKNELMMKKRNKPNKTKRTTTTTTKISSWITYSFSFSLTLEPDTLEDDYEIQEWARLLSATYEDGGCNIKVKSVMVYVTRYIKRYLTILATSCWFGVNSIQ